MRSLEHFTYVYQGTLKHNESEILHLQLELLKCKEELERKLSEKDEKRENVKCLL